MRTVNKQKAIALLGGTIGSAAAAVRVSPSAVSQWPDHLPDRIADRVLAAIARKYLPPELIGEEVAPQGAADLEATRRDPPEPDAWPLQAERRLLPRLGSEAEAA